MKVQSIYYKEIWLYDYIAQYNGNLKAHLIPHGKPYFQIIFECFKMMDYTKIQTWWKGRFPLKAKIKKKKKKGLTEAPEY